MNRTVALGAAVAAVLGAAFTRGADPGLASALFAVGMLLLGAWLVTMVVDWWKDDR